MMLNVLLRLLRLRLGLRLRLSLRLGNLILGKLLINIRLLRIEIHLLRLGVEILVRWRKVVRSCYRVNLLALMLNFLNIARSQRQILVGIEGKVGVEILGSMSPGLLICTIISHSHLRLDHVLTLMSLI